MRVATDGYIDLRDPRRVKTPGYHDHGVDPVPEAEARVRSPVTRFFT